MGKGARAFLGCVLLAALVAGARAADRPMRIVPGGIVRGAQLPDGTFVFRGLPYAAPPVGDLRWKPPAPVIPWNGVRDARVPGPPCLQRSYGWNAADAANGKEDCLYLTVRTPSLAYGRKLPVMVWIHGGANRAGSGFGYAGSVLPEKGVVLVTLQYRLGVFGFLSLPALAAESPAHASGNYALMDQIAALKWVQGNIAKFGGDPENVTLFGQSAGAQDVGLLTLSPLAKGLFQKAIEESGTADFGVPPRSLAGNEALGRDLARLMGAGDDAAGLAQLRAASGTALLDATDKLVAPGIDDNSFIWLQAVADGSVLPQTPAGLLAAGKQNRVSLIIGNNAQELPLYGGPANMDHWIAARFGRNAEAARRFYDRAPDPVLGDAAIQLATDITFRCPANAVAALYTAAGQKVWRYQLDLAAPGSAAPVAHGSDLAYVFDPRPAGDAAWPPVQDYWVNFAKRGDPNGPGLPRWKTWDRAGNYLEFTAQGPRAGTHLRTHICNLLKEP